MNDEFKSYFYEFKKLFFKTVFNLFVDVSWQMHMQ